MDKTTIIGEPKATEVKEPMTPRQFTIRMKGIQKEHGHDDEVCHARADDLMCEVLSSLGYGNGVDVFHDLDKWYA